jgi:hypothetical protein
MYKILREFINIYKYDIIKRCELISDEYLCVDNNIKKILIKLLKKRLFIKYLLFRKIDIKDLNINVISTMLFDFYEYQT